MPDFVSYPNCCGASIITGFSYSVDNPTAYKTEGEWPNLTYPTGPDGKRIPRSTYGSDFEKKCKSTKTGDYMYQIVLNKGQYEKDNMAWPKLLKKHGFEFIRQWNNKTHGVSICYLFVKIVNGGKYVEDPREPPPGWETL